MLSLSKNEEVWPWLFASAYLISMKYIIMSTLTMDNFTGEVVLYSLTISYVYIIHYGHTHRSTLSYPPSSPINSGPHHQVPTTPLHLLALV